MYLYCLLPLRDILSYCYGAIQYMCAESAVKPQEGEDVSFSCMLQPTLTDYVIIYYSLLYSAPATV